MKGNFIQSNTNEIKKSGIKYKCQKQPQQFKPIKIDPCESKKKKMESFMLKHQESASLWNLVITKIFLTFRLYGLSSPYSHNFYPLNHDPNSQ